MKIILVLFLIISLNSSSLFGQFITSCEDWRNGKDIEIELDMANLIDTLEIGIEEYLSMIEYIKLFSITIPENFNDLSILRTSLPVPGESYKKMIKLFEGDYFMDKIMTLFPKYIRKKLDIINDLTDCNLLGAFLKITGTSLLIDPNDYLDFRIPACVVLKDVLDAFGEGEKFKKRMDDVYKRANDVAEELKKAKNELLTIPNLEEFNTSEEITQGEMIFASLYNPGGWAIMDDKGKKKYALILRAKIYYTYLYEYESLINVREKQMKSLFSLSKSSGKNLEKLYYKIKEAAKAKSNASPDWKKIAYNPSTQQELNLINLNTFRKLKNIFNQDDLNFYSTIRAKQINEKRENFLSYCRDKWEIDKIYIVN
jgi:hypothetical protein